MGDILPPRIQEKQDKVWECIRSSEDSDLLKKYWEELTNAFTPPSREWLAFFAAYSSQQNESENAFTLVEALESTMSIDVAKELLKYLDAHDVGSDEDYMHVESAYELFAYDFANGQQIWDALVKRMGDNGKRKTFMERLKIPHLQLEDTLNGLSRFLSESKPGEYENGMTEATKIYNQTKKLVEKRRKHEQDLQMDPSLEKFTEYIDWEWKQPGSTFKTRMIQALYNRALSQYPFSTPLWEEFVTLLGDEDIRERATKAVPWSGKLWAQRIRYTEEELPSEIRTLCSGIWEHEDGYGFAREYAGLGCIERYHKFKTIPEDESSWSEREGGVDDGNALDAYKDRLIQQTLPQISTNPMPYDIFGTFVEICVAREFGDQLIKTGESIASTDQKYERRFWTKYVEGLKRLRLDEQALKSYNQVVQLATQMDWPDELLQDFIDYDAAKNDNPTVRAKVFRKQKQLNDMRNAAMTAQKRAEPEPELEPQPEPEPEPTVTPETTSNKKRKVDKPRDREHNQVIVSGIGSSITDTQLTELFHDCGAIWSITRSEDGTAAAVEFETKRDALAGLTKDQKQVGNLTVTVSSGEMTELWVTNQPPEYTPEDIKTLFSKYGQVVSVRFPTQRAHGKARRFCYVQFSNDIQAYAALEELHQKQIGNHKLIVKLSDPSKRQDRSDEYEVVIKSVDFNFPAAQLREMLDTEIGGVVRFRMPTSKHGHKEHDGYAFVNFDSTQRAEQCVDKWQGRVVGKRQISVTRTWNRLRDNVQQDRNATVQVWNFGDAANEDQLKAVFERVGGVKSVLIDRQHGSASVEFEQQQDCGRAGLLLEGEMVAGKNLTFSKPVPKPVAAATMFKPRTIARK